MNKTSQPILKATVLLSALLTFLCSSKTFGWSAADNGLYSGNQSVEVRIGPLPSQTTGSFPQSKEVYETTMQILRNFNEMGANLTFQTQWFGNNATIQVEGSFDGFSITGDVLVTQVPELMSLDRAQILNNIRATGEVDDILIKEMIDVTETIEKASVDSISYRSETSSMEWQDQFNRGPLTLRKNVSPPPPGPAPAGGGGGGSGGGAGSEVQKPKKKGAKGKSGPMKKPNSSKKKSDGNKSNTKKSESKKSAGKKKGGK